MYFAGRGEGLFLMKALRIFLILIFSLLTISCYGSLDPFYEGNDVDYRTQNFLKLTDATDSTFKASSVSGLSGYYNVLVLTDLHFGATWQEAPFNKLYEWLDSVKGTPEAPEFVLSLGDSANLGKPEQYVEYLAFCEKLKSQYGLKIIFNTCGNHDLYQSHWDNWKDSCYPHTSFYKFETTGFSWYALDTASGRICQNQYNLLKEEFSKDPKPKIVFTHYPVTEFRVLGVGLDETTERNLLIDMMVKNNVKTYLSGHNHYSRSIFLGFNEYVCPSFRYNKGWVVLHINEVTGRADAEFKGA